MESPIIRLVRGIISYEVYVWSSVINGTPGGRSEFAYRRIVAGFEGNGGAPVFTAATTGRYKEYPARASRLVILGLSLHPRRKSGCKSRA